MNLHYLTYDNYDAIEVPFTECIPSDYDGVMGVPISFMNKYCPEQFEILNANDYRKSSDVPEKSHGLVKDKEASITADHDQRREEKRREECHHVCTNPYQTKITSLLQDVSTHMSTAERHMEGSSYEEFLKGMSYYDMVARPKIELKETYRRIFIRFNHQKEG